MARDSTLTEPTPPETAALVLVGNELLSGKVQERNLEPLAATLRALGIKLARVVVVADDTAQIAAEVRAASAGYDVVFTSGGVGPTHDDVTLQGVADGFGVQLEPHPHLVALLRSLYGERCTDDHLLMARAPVGAELHSNAEIKWPVVVMRNVWVLPGVPELFRMKLSVVRDHLRGPAPIVSRALYSHMEETELKPMLDRVVEQHRTVEIGSYPKWFDPTYKTKLTFDGTNEAEVDAAHAALLALLPAAAIARVG
ncbi:MAG TPA: competence/damage-inducible protein A [Polyangiaceae bacterium]|nr:competence/damage-inducible protein A [Polyangiaceae bacterium]